MPQAPKKPATKSSPKKPSGKSSAAPKSAASKSTSPFGAGVWPSAGLNTFTSATTPKNMESFMNKSQSQFDAFYKDQGAAFKEALEAYSKSGKVTAERMQEFMNYYMEFYQNYSSQQANAFQNMMACKTANDVAEAQTKFAQDSFNEMMQAFTKFSQFGMQFASEAFEPFGDQFGKVMKKATDTMAA